MIFSLGVEETNTNKLITFFNYKMPNRRLVEYLKKFGAVTGYSELTSKQQNNNVDRFLTDSAGTGLNLQGVSSDVLFLETPLVPKDFHESVGRLNREGQTKTPNIRIAIAAGTIQGHLHRQLLKKDELVNKVQIGFKDLKEAIYGR